MAAYRPDQPCYKKIVLVRNFASAYDKKFQNAWRGYRWIENEQYQQWLFRRAGEQRSKIYGHTKLFSHEG